MNEAKGMYYIRGYEDCLDHISKQMKGRINANEKATDGSYLNVVNDLILYLHHLELRVSEWYEEEDENLNSLEEEYMKTQEIQEDSFFGIGEINLSEEGDSDDWMEEMITAIKRIIPDDVEEIKIELRR